MIISYQNEKLSRLASFFLKKSSSSPEYKKPVQHVQQDQRESKYMNRVNRDRLYDVIPSNSVGQGWILLDNVGQDFTVQQCWTVKKSKKLHLEQMEWVFGGLLDVLDTLDAK